MEISKEEKELIYQKHNEESEKLWLLIQKMILDVSTREFTNKEAIRMIKILIEIHKRFY